jgi:hypothetical protein
MKTIRTFIILSACIFCFVSGSVAQTDSAGGQEDSSAVVSEKKSRKEKSRKGRPFKVISKSGNINNVQVTKKGGTSGEVKIIIIRMNKPVSVNNLEIKTDNGNFYSDKFTVSKYPMEATIQFQAPSATGFGSSMEQYSCKVTVSENGIWEIRINLANV